MKRIVLGLSLLVLVADMSAAGKTCCLRKKKKSQTRQAAPVMKAAKMGRTACFGTCPVYQVQVFDNGLVRYTGQSHVPNIGVFERTVPASEAQALLQRFAAYRPDTCSLVYKLRIADLPGIRYEISYKDSTKSIGNADAGPAFLKEMAREFDALGQVDQSWKKVKELP